MAHGAKAVDIAGSVRLRRHVVDRLRGSGMIGPSGNVRVYLACGVTDMRRGIDGLSALVEAAIKEALMSWHFKPDAIG